MTPGRGRLMLLGLGALFMAPLIVAWALYDVLGWRGEGRAAAGHLVTPAMSLPAIPRSAGAGRATDDPADLFQGPWTLLQMSSAACRKACREALRRSYRVCRLQHVRALRVHRVLLLGDNVSSPKARAVQPDLEIVRTDLAAWRSMSAARDADTPGTILLIDPAGRWMAFYRSSDSAEALYDNITQLLARSGSP